MVIQTGSFNYSWYEQYVASRTSPTTATTTTTPPLVIATPPTVVPADQISTVTGIDPAEVAAATYGKIIPIWVGGMPRLGCHVIYGPTITTTSGISYASFGVSFGLPANNIGTRELRELRLDGFKVWSLTEGYLIPGLTFRFYPGTETQPHDPLVIAAYPTAPVAHKGMCCVFIEALALTDYNLKVPFVSAVIADTTEGEPEDGVLLGDALEQLAYSPYVGLGDDPVYGSDTEIDFSTTDISERVDALICAEKISFLELINRFARLHLWDIVQREQLEAIERGTVAPDISLDFTDIVGSGDAPPILIERAPPSDLPRELDYSYIDIDRDYEINTITASRMSIPTAATRSDGKDSIALPVVHTAHEALAWATLRRYKDDLARETVSFTTSIVGYEIEPGDVVSVDAGFKTYSLRVLETLKGANWTNRIKAEPILRCALPVSAAPLDNVVCVKSAWSLSRTLLSTWTASRYTEISGGISQIADQNGLGRHFVDDGGATTRPTAIAAGPNSRIAADFDGSNDYMDTLFDLSNFIEADESYAVVSLIVDAVTLTDVDTVDNHCIIGDGSKQWGIYASAAGGLTIHGFNFNGSSDTASQVRDLAVPLVISLRHESGVLYLRVNNGVEIATASGNTASLIGDLRLGKSDTGTEINMKFFEAALFNCVPAQGVRDALEQDMIQWVGAGGEVAGDWTPAEISTLLWLDADDDTTFTFGSGTAVSQWDDKSGNSNHVAQTTSANRPSYDAVTNTINGMAVVSFDGSNDRLDNSALTGFPSNVTGYTAIAIFRDRNVADNIRNVVDISDIASCNRTFQLLTDANVTGTSIDVRSRCFDAGTTDGVYTGGVSSLSAVRLVAGFGSTTKRQSFWFGDSGAANTTAETSGGGNFLRLGMNWCNTTVTIQDMAEIVIFSGESDTNRQLVEGYLAWKWGVQASLVAGHPYKSIPPMI